MSLDKFIFVALMPLLISACGGEAVDDQTGRINDPLWDSDSQRIQIFQAKGPYAFTVEEEWDLSSDELTNEQLVLLGSTRQVFDGLSCATQDEVTYEVLVTLGSGIQRRFVSDNLNCGSMNQFRFLNRTDILQLIASIDPVAVMTPLQLLENQRSIWAAFSISDYSYRFDYECWSTNCSSLDYPVELAYRSDSISTFDTAYSSSTVTINDSGSKFYSIPELFSRLEELLNSNPGYVNVTYDQSYGYPSKIEFNPEAGSTSFLDEHTYSISNFVAQ